MHPLWFYKHQHDNQNRHWNHHRWHATNSLERTRLSCWCLKNHKGCIYRAPVRYVTKTWSVVLLNKKYTYSYLKCVVYDKLLKPRQSFRITLYNGRSLYWWYIHLMHLSHGINIAPPQKYRREHVQRTQCHLKFTKDCTKQYILFQQNNKQKINILFNKYVIYDEGSSQWSLIFEFIVILFLFQ